MTKGKPIQQVIEVTGVAGPEATEQIERLRRKIVTIEKVDNGFIVKMEAGGAPDVYIVEQWIRTVLRKTKRFFEEL